MEKTEEFARKVEHVFPNEFKVLGEYKNSGTKIEVQHLPCGEIYSVYQYDFLNKRYAKCRKCNQLDRMFNKLDRFLEDNDLSEEYTYERGDTTYQYEKLQFFHKKCESSFPKGINSFYSGQMCPYCIGAKTNKNSAQIRIDELTSIGEFVLLNEDCEITAHESDIRILHTSCNRVTETTLAYFVIQNPACAHCTKENWNKNRTKTHSEFVDELAQLFGAEYEPIEEYVTALTPIDILHLPCGNILKLKPSALLSLNSGCKYCNMSSPERLIDSVLKEHEIKYKTQYKFHDCKSDKNIRLPFDFALFVENNLSIIIEYDGQHHFHENAFGKESYDRTVKNDLIKNEYCIKNNIKLIRIPYTEQHRLREIVEAIISQDLVESIVI
jgi:hypothetical protein